MQILDWLLSRSSRQPIVRPSISFKVFGVGFLLEDLTLPSGFVVFWWFRVYGSRAEPATYTEYIRITQRNNIQNMI